MAPTVYLDCQQAGFMLAPVCWHSNADCLSVRFLHETVGALCWSLVSLVCTSTRWPPSSILGPQVGISLWCRWVLGWWGERDELMVQVGLRERRKGRMAGTGCNVAYLCSLYHTITARQLVFEGGCIALMAPSRLWQFTQTFPDHDCCRLTAR
jgi:hypothetical protein